MKPPTFFLSSTIYDFKDLRSALKYHLERQGCRVLASEFNDFSKPLDAHSYDACLRAKQEADWFVLLIGARVGGWYDEVNKISITQQEYREAYRLHQSGHLNLLVFVRLEVWQTREERKQLAAHLDELGVENAQKSRIVNYPSRSATDAEFISSFISEVGRNHETLKARSTGGKLPTGNWIHVFNTFQDIAEAIQFQPFAGRPVEDTAHRRLLKRELWEILRGSLVMRTDRSAISPQESVERFYAEHKVTFPKNNNDRVLVSVKSFDQLCSYAIYLMNMRHHPQVLSKAIESSVFTYFDRITGRVEEEKVYAGLLRLAEEIRLFQLANQTEATKIVFENAPSIRPRRSNQIDVVGMQLLLFMHLMDRWCNVITLCKAIILHLDGVDFQMPVLRPASPVVEEHEAIAQEHASDQEMAIFLAR